ncbi:hypothetical protein BDF22DRAFT_742723 [Syncephalis plumigaleata]|nr:hypothetical protein BDF22DRAFT_742723 [Syncephalis plumigaleata]
MFSLFKRPTASPPSDRKSAPPCYHVEGFLDCAYFHAAVNEAEQLEKNGAVVNVRSFDDRMVWLERLHSLQERVKGAGMHTTSPMVFTGCREREWQLIGGYSELKEHVASSASP